MTLNRNGSGFFSRFWVEPRLGTTPHFAPPTPQNPVVVLKCAGMTALWNWQTCLPVPKRRPVAALHISDANSFPCKKLHMQFLRREERSQRLDETWPLAWFAQDQEQCQDAPPREISQKLRIEPANGVDNIVCIDSSGFFINSRSGITLA
jgi:hypothetical protein